MEYLYPRERALAYLVQNLDPEFHEEAKNIIMESLKFVFEMRRATLLFFYEDGIMNVYGDGTDMASFTFSEIAPVVEAYYDILKAYS